MKTSRRPRHLKTPSVMLVVVVMFAVAATNAYLYFAYYLPRTSSISTNPQALGGTDKFPDLEDMRQIYTPHNTSSAPTGKRVLVGAGDIASC